MWIFILPSEKGSKRYKLFNKDKIYVCEKENKLFEYFLIPDNFNTPHRFYKNKKGHNFIEKYFESIRITNLKKLIEII